MTVQLLSAASLKVQLYADPQGNGGSEIHAMEVAEAAGTANSYLYRARIPALRPAEHYTPLIIPYFDGATVPLEARQILWFES
jgi:starch phosphorylase